MFVLSGTRDEHTTATRPGRTSRGALQPNRLGGAGEANGDLDQFAGGEYERRILGFLNAVAPLAEARSRPADSPS